MFGKEKKPIKFRAIIELMGRPPEFLTETLNKAAEQLEQDDKLKIKILHKQVFEPKETDEKDIFSNFIEMELEALAIESIFEFIINYLPSNVEIISPSELSFDLSSANALIHTVLSKIHFYDSTTKRTSFENMVLKKRLGEFLSVKVEENVIEAKKVEKESESLKESKEHKKSKKK
jgi:hypothetical protein